MFGGDGAVVKLAGLESDSVTVESLVRASSNSATSRVICGAAARRSPRATTPSSAASSTKPPAVEKLGNTIPEA